MDLQHLRDALSYLEGARFENYSGQVIAEHDDKKKDYIVFDLTCTCSEVPGSNADELADMLVTVLNGAQEALKQYDALKNDNP